MKPEYHFTQGHVEQGKFKDFSKRVKARQRNLSSEMAERFPNDEVLNQALNEYLRMKREAARIAEVHFHSPFLSEENLKKKPPSA